MTSRLRYALWTQVGPWVALPAAVLELVNLLQRRSPYLGEGLWTVEWAAIALFVICPLVCGAAAFDAARLSRPGIVHLVSRPRRAFRAHARATLWCVAPVGLVHLLAVSGALVVGGVTRPSIGWVLLIAGLLVQLLTIAWFGAVGSALGRHLRPLGAGLVGSAIGFALTYVLGSATSGQSFRLLDLGAATISRLGLTYDHRYLGAQLLVLAASGALLLVLPTRGRGAFRLPSTAGIACLLAATASLGAAQTMLPGGRLQAAPVAPTSCAEAGVRVCFFEEHHRYEPDAQRSIRTLVIAARAKGYSSLVPSGVTEASRTFQAAGSSATFSLPLNSQGPEPTLEDWAYELTLPKHCAALSGDAPLSEGFWTRQETLVATWAHLAGVRAPLSDDGPGVHILSPAQTARVMADYRRCRL